jgi:hypothetical protein
MIPFLERNNAINRILGKCRHRFAGTKAGSITGRGIANAWLIVPAQTVGTPFVPAENYLPTPSRELRTSPAGQRHPAGLR